MYLELPLGHTDGLKRFLQIRLSSVLWTPIFCEPCEVTLRFLGDPWCRSDPPRWPKVPNKPHPPMQAEIMESKVNTNY